MNAKDRELLTALLEHNASGWIPEIHLDDCNDTACTGCESQHLAEQAAVKADEYRYCGADLGRSEFPFTCYRRVAHEGPCGPDMDATGGTR